MQVTSLTSLIYRFAALAAAVVTLGTLLGLVAPVSAHGASFPPLNQPAAARHVTGKFVWGDLFTSEPETAAAFYCSLFGWTSAAVEQKDKSYFILSHAGHPVAGIVQRPTSSEKRAGVWVGYISVPDAKATLAKVAAAGGTERAPVRDFPKRGLQAIFSDNEGSVVGILQSSSGDPLDDEPDPGEWNWFQLFSNQPQSSAEFYRRVIGYEVVDDTATEKDNHLVFTKGGQPRAGVAPLPKRADSHPGWIGAVRVVDIEAVAAQATGLGGKVIIAPRPAAYGSRFAVIADPTGGQVGLVQYVDNANPKAQP